MIGDAQNARDLDRRVRIEKRTTTVSSYGDSVVAYSLRAEVWAAVIHTNGRERYLAEQEMPATDVEFRMRWRSDVLETDRIVHDGKDYEIRYIAEMGRRRRLRIVASLMPIEGVN